MITCDNCNQGTVFPHHLCICPARYCDLHLCPRCWFAHRAIHELAGDDLIESYNTTWAQIITEWGEVPIVHLEDR